MAASGAPSGVVLLATVGGALGVSDARSPNKSPTDTIDVNAASFS